MDINDVLSLVKAGFNADQITDMLEGQGSDSTPDSAPDSTPDPAPDADNDTIDNSSSTKKPSGEVTLSATQLNEIKQAINRQNAQVDLPPKKELKDTLQAHFNGLYNNEED